jgi:DNA repair exonuclease SbcCD ATPase subunit
MSPQTITRLEVSNVKRLRAVTINPAGNLVVIGGDNANGKTSVLDSIAMAIGGKGAVPERPIREGQTRASIILETQDIIVERTFSANSGSSLIVKKKDGSRLTSPQAVLDALTNKIAFDPLEFIHLEPKKQAETLRTLAGIDFTQLDAKRQAAYDSRTDLNRKVKELEAVLKQTPFDPELPAEEISVASLAAKLQELNGKANENDRLREQLSTANDRVEEFGEAIAKRQKS